MNPILPDHQIVLLKRGEIEPDAQQPRRHRNAKKMAELEESMRQHGFTAAVSHLLVRPMPVARGLSAPYLLVIGEGRWITSGTVGIEEVPAVIEEMSDARALGLQLVENLIRDDLTKLDEADGIRRLLEIVGDDGEKNTRASVAAKIGRSVDHIGDMLQICRLDGTAAGEALDAGVIGMKHALALARVPAGKLRDGLTKRVLRPADGIAPMPYRQLETIIREEYMVELRGAEFNQEDAELIPMESVNGERSYGGACTDCPFNTRNTEEGGHGCGASRIHCCINPECFREKSDIAHDLWMESIRQKGKTPLTLAEAEKVFDITGKKLGWNSGYVELQASPTDADLRAGCAGPAWKQLIKGQDVPVIVAKDAAGKAHELVKHDLALAAARKNEETQPAAERIFKAPAASAATDGENNDNSFNGEVKDLKAEAEARNAVAERQKKERIILAQFGAIVEAADTTKVPDLFWALAMNALCCALARGLDADDIEYIADSNGWLDLLDADEGYHKGLIAGARKLNAAGRFQFIAEALMWLDLHLEATLPKWAKAFGVDLRPIKKRIEAEIAAEQASSSSTPVQGQERGQTAIEGIKGGNWAFFPLIEDFKWSLDKPATCENPARLTIHLRRGSMEIKVAHAQGMWYGGYEIRLNDADVSYPVAAEKGRPTLTLAVIDEAYGAIGWLRNQKAPSALIEEVSTYIQALLKLDDPDPAAITPAMKASRKKKGGKK